MSDFNDTNSDDSDRKPLLSPEDDLNLPQPPALDPETDPGPDFDYEAQEFDAFEGVRQTHIEYRGVRFRVEPPGTLAESAHLFMAVDHPGELLLRALAVCVTRPDPLEPHLRELTPYERAQLGASVLDCIDLQAVVDEVESLRRLRDEAVLD